VRPTSAPAVAPTVPSLDDEPLTLPAAWTPPARPPLPLVAAIVPVVGAGALWLVAVLVARRIMGSVV
jgi:S-DNA-T family DNA segregation ATPase FtsK/SpoIIIE